jgi:hypothetical protein
MSNRSIYMKAEPLRQISALSISGAYAPVGTPFGFPSHIIHIQNTTNQEVLISFDGVTDNELVGAGSFVLLDISANMTRSEGFFFPKGMIVYARDNGVAPGSGAVYVSTYYGTDNNG